MPVTEQNLMVAPARAAVSLSVEPAQNAIHSMMLLVKGEKLSGLDEWVYHTAASLAPEEAEQHRLVLVGLHYAVQPRRSWPSFPAYLQHLGSLPPRSLVDKLLDAYARIPPRKDGVCHDMGDTPLPIDREEILSNVDSYLRFLKERFTEEAVDHKVESEAYHLLNDPPALQALVLSHLRFFWESYLEPEWQRVEPMLRDAVAAFNEVDFRQMSHLEAAEFVTGQSLADSYLKSRVEAAERLLFVPSAHVGPYLSSFKRGATLGLIFGARLPAGTHFEAPDLSRAEIVVRLSALADDTRLRILKLVAEEGEQRSQEIMERLELSQSAASRHLQQLTATGYLSARRCSGAKCYRINSERLEDTLQAVSLFLTPS